MSSFLTDQQMLEMTASDIRSITANRLLSDADPKVKCTYQEILQSAYWAAQRKEMSVSSYVNFKDAESLELLSMILNLKGFWHVRIEAENGTDFHVSWSPSAQG